MADFRLKQNLEYPESLEFEFLTFHLKRIL
jgi:hypothetical protein